MCVDICLNCNRAVLVRCSREEHKDHRIRWKNILPVYKCSCNVHSLAPPVPKTAPTVAKTKTKSSSKDKPLRAV